MKNKKVINMVKSIKSAKLCLDGAIKRKKESQDITSHLYQFCLQLAKYCEEQDHKKLSLIHI